MELNVLLAQLVTESMVLFVKNAKLRIVLNAARTVILVLNVKTLSINLMTLIAQLPAQMEPMESSQLNLALTVTLNAQNALMQLIAQAAKLDSSSMIPKAVFMNA